MDIGLDVADTEVMHNITARIGFEAQTRERRHNSGNDSLSLLDIRECD